MTKSTRTPDLARPLTLLRGPISRGLTKGQQPADRAGGDFGAGLLRGAAVITRGEALGHGVWIDNVMLQQTHDAIKAAGKSGVKARFTHPGLSADGLGSFLGRYKNPLMDGDVVRADIHFAESAHDTPDGDLADYVMSLADEDPEAFGNSIVFRHDWLAEDEFENANQQEVEETDGNGRTVKRMRFRSPDQKNTEHLPHARLKQLRAIDTVDSPAANPSGMFHATAVAGEADDLLAYACGLTTERPELSTFDIEPDRVQGFVTKFLAGRGLELKSKTQEASTMPPVISAEMTADPAADPRAEFSAQLQAYVAEFGAANGAQWAAEAKPLDECRTLHAASIAQQRAAELAAKDATIATLTGERDALQLRINQAKLGEVDPVAFSPEAGTPESNRLTSALGGRLGAYAASLRLAKN